MEKQFLGQIFIPANPGTPVGKFEFLVDRHNGGGVEVGTPVAADTSEGVVVGTVTDMRTVGSLTDPMSAMLDGYGTAPIATMEEVMVASVQVFYSPSLRPVRAGRVRSATPEEMLQATGYSNMDWPIPAGVVPMSDGSFAKVCFDGKALLGPESQGLNVGGLSGQAAKSSYIGTLLRSAINAGSTKESVGAIIFNVKGTDFIYMDKPPAEGYELSEEDLKIYDALGVPSTPFEDVTVYAPAMPAASNGTRSPREDSSRLHWDLPMIWPYIRYFAPWLSEDEKWQSFRAEFEEELLNHPNPTIRVDSFAKLDRWMEDKLAYAEGDKDEGRERSQYAWKSHHVASFRRFRRFLSALPARCGGLLTMDQSKFGEDVPVTGWTHGQVVVVDIAGLHTDVQAVVIARTVERLLRSAENGQLGVDHLMLVADELNAFAPSTGGEMAAVKKILQKVATQGRYAGISLIGAGQALSKVDDLVVSNAASSALGRTADAELASGVYGRMQAGLLERIATLPKGWMALKHYSFRSTLLVRFPRPAWMTGKAKTLGATRPSTVSALSLSEKSLARVREGVPEEVVEKLIASSNSPQEAIDKISKSRVPDMTKTVLHAPSTFDPDNPFDFSEE